MNNNKLSIKIIKLNPDAVLPKYETEFAAGMDLRACIKSPIVIQPLERLNIPTGLAVELPIGYELQIRARSGLSINHGITMINGIGTIDCDYRGEMGILLVNLSNIPFTIEPGMRIAQMVVAKYEHVILEEVEILSQTERGEKGFGNTGL